ncbi:NfeD family protein [Georgenia thermotolerans]|uniref:NfeD family protein n=1 Tax=Georgenia thermotolerans TaxID=527326 RepID=A0A7J5UN26_9MICO|nr:NfeD family protein [Georgenia thermotolerans]KAE8763796.1 NfeD family protein [Georgenia thermotolerans]
MAWLWWLGAALVLGVVELVTVDLIFLMFAGGALAGALAALLGAPLWGQVLVFAVVSVVLLFGVRPWAKRLLARSTPDTLTNVAAHVGREATVLIDVTERAGRIKLMGEVWTARAARSGTVLPAGTTVRVVRIDGAIAVVEATADTTLHP